MRYLGVDPGKSGALAIIDDAGRHIDHIKLSETAHDVANWLKTKALDIDFACIEKVHSMPRQGVASSFRFGESFGFVQGIVIANRIRYELVTPQKWQKELGCRTKGDKNVSKARAQQLWPDIRITHAIADALLIAEYARRLRA